MSRLVGNRVFDFFSQALSVDKTGRGAPATRLLFLITSMLLVFLLWTSIVELDQVVSAQGKAVPFASLQVVEHYEGGRVETIFVRAGDHVESGALLVALSPLQTSGEFNVQKKNLALLTISLARLDAEYKGKKTFVLEKALSSEFKEYVASELALFRDRTSKAGANLAQLRSDIDANLAMTRSAKVRLTSTMEEFEVTRQLVARGLEARLSLIRSQSGVAEAESAVVASEQDLKRSQAAFSSALSQRQEEILAELTKVRTELTQVNESLLVSADKADRTDIRSPISGTVNRVLVSTMGSTVKPGDPVVEIVPQDSRMVVEVNVAPQDIGFIRRGQRALIKFSAYDYSIFGPMDGTVDVVGSDSIDTGANGETVFVVKLVMAGPYIGSDGSKLPIIPGMQAQVDIITGKRTLMAYFFSPFSKALDSSFRER
jgi:adhesin transport system membrane fusion protein